MLLSWHWLEIKWVKRTLFGTLRTEVEHGHGWRYHDEQLVNSLHVTTMMKERVSGIDAWTQTTWSSDVFGTLKSLVLITARKKRRVFP